LRAIEDPTFFYKVGSHLAPKLSALGSGRVLHWGESPCTNFLEGGTRFHLEQLITQSNIYLQTRNDL
jgi:hypothetical protein